MTSNLRLYCLTLSAIALSGCASDIHIDPSADATARAYAECREWADALYAKVSRYPTPHAFPFFPYGADGHYFGNQMTDGDLDIATVAKLPCFRQGPPEGVRIGQRIRNQIERERRYLYPQEYIAFRQVCGGSGSLEDCSVYRVLMAGCKGDLRRCSEVAGNSGREAFNVWLKGVIRYEAERGGSVRSQTAALVH